MITVKELKEKLKDVPDNYEIAFYYGVCGDIINLIGVHDVEVDTIGFVLLKH